jgi:hypothetical protein
MTEQPTDATPPGPSRTPLLIAIAVAVALVLIAAIAIIAARSDDNDVITAPTTSSTTSSTSSSTTTTVAPSTTRAPSTTSAPTSAPTTAVAPSSTASPAASVQLRPDGLGVATFGDDMDATIAALTAKLGAPTDPGTVAPGQCSPRLQRTVGWNNLQVGFAKPDTGDKLLFEGFIYGHTDETLPTPTAATPALTTPGGFGVTGKAQTLEALLAQVRVDFPNAQLSDTADPDVKNIDQVEGTLKLDAVLQRQGDGWSTRFIEVVKLAGTLC